MEPIKLKKKRSKILIFIAVVCAAAAAASFVIYTQAQFFSDSFTTEDNVDETWRITVATTTGEVKLEEKTCDDGVWFCGAGYDDVCANSAGDGNYIVVKMVNEATTKQWKPANTACDRPQCGTDGGQDNDNLVSDNTVNFSGYPARDACKAAGGRLPTKTELQCIYANRILFGNNFGTSLYWSSTEGSATSAWNVYFSTGSTGNTNKSGSYSVRCVRGW